MARTLVLDTITEPGNSGTANITLSSNTTTTMPLVDINGGAIDGTTLGVAAPSSVAATTLTTTGNVTLGNASSDTVTINSTVSGSNNKSGMTGEVRMWSGASAPTGWLFCNGASIARSGTYAALFAITGTAYGTASSSTFNVPDMEGRAPVGVGTGAGDASEDADGGTTPSGTALTARSLGEWTGRETIVALPAHTHTMSSHVHTLNNHTHTMSSHTHNLGNHSHTMGNHTHNLGNHSHGGIYVPWQGGAKHTTAGHADGGHHAYGLMNTDSNSTYRGSTNSNNGNTGANNNATSSNNGNTGANNGATAGPNTTNTGANNGATASTGVSGKHTIPIMCINFIIKY
jgi:microcystin-dependent protein